MAQMCPAKSTIVPFKKQMYSSGSIILSYKDDKCICVSIHAPTRGATVELANKVRKCLVSIHAPTRGATRFRSYSPPSFSSFNPRTHEGCDLSHRHMFTAQVGFQSTHPRGVRLSHRHMFTAQVGVSIHAPTRGATG